MPTHPLIHRSDRAARFICALFLWIAPLGAAFGETSAGPSVDAEAQTQVAHLIEQAIGPFRSVEGPKVTGTNAAWETSLRVEKAFREASRLMPERLDLRFCLATTLLGEATQTNSIVRETKMHEALSVYQDIRAMDTNSFEAGILYAAYTRAIGETNASESAIDELISIQPVPAREYIEKFRRIDSFLEVTPNETIRRFEAHGADHAIVVLGAALETNGVAKAKLVSRLLQALKLARANPKSPIIVTGGNQRQGVTEAYIMSQWLRRHGISEKRIRIEDLARDTVGNALYSSVLLEKLKVTDVTVVTSLSHVRRSLALLDEACRKRGLTPHLANLAAQEKPPAPDPIAERIATYRDVMRVSGLWAYPGILR